MNNTSQIIDVGQAANYTSSLPYADWPLALGIGITLGVFGFIGVGITLYWWCNAPGPLPDTDIIHGNNLENCCFNFVLDFFNLNIPYQILIIYIIFVFMIFMSYNRSNDY